MKKRCKDSKFLKKINLKDFRLTFRSKYRAADIEPKKNSFVPGGLFEISKSDEKKLDIYEDYPNLYKKYYFYYYGKKIMTYNEIKRFIMFYERITLQMLKDLSKSASIVMLLKKNHEVKKILFR